MGLVDDERFAQEVAASMRRRGMGRRAGISALRAKGVAAEVAEVATEEIDQGDEETRAEEVARIRLRRLDGLQPEVARRRLLGFLLRRGFDSDAARAATRRVLEEQQEAS
ncbi:MAG: RecX family transcriptional regulator [Actinomycetota bacterium]